MPELPEVESLRRYLIAEGVPGRIIVSVEAKWPKTIKAPEGPGFLSGVAGRTITDVGRRGKYLLLPLAGPSPPPSPGGRGSSAGLPRRTPSGGGVLILHMGMTGSLALMTPDDAPQRFAHTVFYLDDERRVELNDPRKWASVWLVEDADEVVGKLGPEPLDGGFSPDVFFERVRRRRAPIKTVLLDQSVLAGVGNIYADEALLRAGISPTRRADRISRARAAVLHEAIREALTRAISHIGDHPDDDGRPFVVDAYDDRMEITRRKGALCPKCGSPLRARTFGNRTAYYCVHCQH